MVREIQYKFWQQSQSGSKEQSPPLKELDTMYSRSEKAMNTYKAQCSAKGIEADDELQKKWDQLAETSNVINTEECLVRHLEQPEETSTRKLQRRQAAAVQFYDQVHILIQEKVRAHTGM